ncbi:hypothetical protein CJ030_MR2G023031 [Morella rubra]|uniref:Uncharacterized protein n=1 Tax=Morella rubra TaxID=262757 RepID=A0A6A1WFK4_9ROSI|nr:hypothetical protein CJ030_MR2G023031 [Morella rubra]
MSPHEVQHVKLSFSHLTTRELVYNLLELCALDNQTSNPVLISHMEYSLVEGINYLFLYNQHKHLNTIPPLQPKNSIADREIIILTLRKQIRLHSMETDLGAFRGLSSGTEIYKVEDDKHRKRVVAKAALDIRKAQSNNCIFSDIRKYNNHHVPSRKAKRPQRLGKPPRVSSHITISHFLSDHSLHKGYLVRIQFSILEHELRMEEHGFDISYWSFALSSIALKRASTRKHRNKLGIKFPYTEQLKYCAILKALYPDNGVTQYGELLDCVKRGGWDSTKNFLELHPQAMRARITYLGQTALHVGIEAHHTDIVEPLVAMMLKKDLEIIDFQGKTSLYCAIAVGNWQMTKCLVRRNKNLVSIGCFDTKTLPVFAAIMYGHKEMARYVYKHTSSEYLKPEKGDNGASALFAAIYTRSIDISLHLMKVCPRLAFTRDDAGASLAPRHNYPRKTTLVSRPR